MPLGRKELNDGVTYIHVGLKDKQCFWVRTKIDDGATYVDVGLIGR